MVAPVLHNAPGIPGRPQATPTTLRPVVGRMGAAPQPAVSAIQADLGATVFGIDLTTSTGLLSESGAPPLDVPLTAEQSVIATAIGSAALADGSNPGRAEPLEQLRQRSRVQGQYRRQRARAAVLRQSYLQTNEDLRLYADKVKFYNACRRRCARS